MLKAIIFDVDGTLAETEEWHRRAFNIAFMLEGYDWFWDRALYVDLLKVTGGKERIRHFVADYQVGDIDDAGIGRLHLTKNRIYAEFVTHGMIALRPGMMDLIDDAAAAGLALAIATTTSMNNVKALMAATLGASWRTRFAVVVSGEMVMAKKPAPDAYLIALSALGVAPQDAVALEDSRNGLLAATAAGLKTVCLRSRYCQADDLSGASCIYEDSATLTWSRLSSEYSAALP